RDARDRCSVAVKVVARDTDVVGRRRPGGCERSRRRAGDLEIPGLRGRHLVAASPDGSRHDQNHQSQRHEQNFAVTQHDLTTRLPQPSLPPPRHGAEESAAAWSLSAARVRSAGCSIPRSFTRAVRAAMEVTRVPRCGQPYRPKVTKVSNPVPVDIALTPYAHR